MRLQIIKSGNGKPEYILLPIAIYEVVREIIDVELQKKKNEDFVPFYLPDYIDNPVALARIQAHVTQEELADLMGVKQSYISRLENQDTVSHKVLEKVNRSLAQLQKK